MVEPGKERAERAVEILAWVLPRKRLERVGAAALPGAAVIWQLFVIIR